MKRLSILGSTGSIGTQTLSVVKKYPKKFSVVGLSTNQNIALLKKQIALFRPEAVAVMDKEKADVLEDEVDVPVYSGIKGVNKIATLGTADTVVNALVGSIGVEPTYAAIQKGKNIALANKETLVAAGEVIMGEVERRGVELLPIDSEHSAILQCMQGESRKAVRKITITCSGGPFRNFTKKQMSRATIKDALKHPTWSMGAKITVDSSTWMNKGFEVIEAHWLFGMPYEHIDVVVHPQSIIHSLVEFSDHSVMAQMGWPDMSIPIQYALTYPVRVPTATARLDLTKAQKLEFLAPDLDRFPCLKFAYDAGKKGGVLPAVLNAANEVAVQAFIDGEIGYTDIPLVIAAMMSKAKVILRPSLTTILDIDARIKKEAAQLVRGGLR